MTIMTWISALLGFFSFLGGPDKPATVSTLNTRMTRMSTWFMTYRRDLAPPAELSLIVTPDQGCLLHVTGPVFGINFPNRSEIGTYHWPCSTAEAEMVRGLFDPAMAEAAAFKGVDVPRGTRFLTFGLGSRGSDKVDPLASVPLRQQLPQAIAKYDETMIALARKALDHPFIALKAVASPADSVLDPKGDLCAKLRLSNSGTSPIQIANPAANATATVSLNLKDADGQFTFIEVKPGEISQIGEDGKAIGDAPAITKLKPGTSILLAIRIRRHVYLHKGRYDVQLKYTSDTKDIPETEAIRGLVQTDAGHIAVTAKGGH